MMRIPKYSHLPNKPNLLNGQGSKSTYSKEIQHIVFYEYNEWQSFKKKPNSDFT